MLIPARRNVGPESARGIIKASYFNVGDFRVPSVRRTVIGVPPSYWVAYVESRFPLAQEEFGEHRVEKVSPNHIHREGCAHIHRYIGSL